jgi:ABC-type phosphate transport system substrate-binding protein
MEKAAKGTEAKPQDLVIPVAQAAIAVMVNPPAGCTITQITNTHLEEVFRGTLKEWKSIATGSGCAGEITRVVRKDGSGTTYQFKHYLFEINSGKLKGTNIGSGERTWAELQEEPQKNIEWPEEAGVLSPLVHAKNSGGGGEAEEVLAKSGSIGYAVLADARPKFNKEVENHYHWVKLQNKGNKVGEEFEYPGTATGEPTSTEAESNCVKTDYVGFNKSTFKVAADQDWSAVYGGNPNGLNAHYSLCTLTWDVGLASYTQAGLTAAQGEAAKEYLQYVVKATGGQEAFKGHDYRNVEEAVGTYAVEMAALVN